MGGDSGSNSCLTQEGERCRHCHELGHCLAASRFGSAGTGTRSAMPPRGNVYIVLRTWYIRVLTTSYIPTSRYRVYYLTPHGRMLRGVGSTGRDSSRWRDHGGICALVDLREAISWGGNHYSNVSCRRKSTFHCATHCLLETRSLILMGGEGEVENSSVVTGRLGPPGPWLITRQCCISAEVLAAALLWLLLPTYIVLGAPTGTEYVNGLVVVVQEPNPLIDILFLHLLLSKVSQ